MAADTKDPIRDIPSLRDMKYENQTEPGRPLDEFGRPLDELANTAVAASTADLNRYAAEGAKYQCISGHRGLHWDHHFKAVLCGNCGGKFADLQPLRDQVKQQDSRWDTDEYMRGMFNGLECALATLEGRDPCYR